MGNSRWEPSSYATLKADYSTKSRDVLFVNNQKGEINKNFDPKNIDIRESCDSEKNPLSTALIFALDVTGSMGSYAEAIAKEDLGVLVEEILERKPVTDPHIMMMGIGDAHYDQYPLQVTQFEANTLIAEQLVELYLEGGGGGNRFESYDLAWAFAAQKTKIDCFDKRGKKGYIFTLGDEEPPHTPSKKILNESIGFNFQSEPTDSEILEAARERYNVFHLMIEEGSHMRYNGSKTRDKWVQLLGNRALLVDNHKHIPQIVVSAIMVEEGAEPDEVIAQWEDSSVRNSVERAIYGPSHN